MEMKFEIEMLKVMLQDVSAQLINEKIENSRLRAISSLTEAKEKEVIEDGGIKPKAK